VHEQVRAVPVEPLPDLVALSFFSGFARRAYATADAFRARGVRVVAGGPHVSYWVDEALEHVDAVVTGEAESVWPTLLADAGRGRLQRVYRGEPRPLAGLPTPRYDLLERRFVVPRVIQATRGCPFHCAFCTVPDLNPGFRARPVDEVMRDVTTSGFALPFQERVAWFWDDNLLVDRRYARELLAAMRGADRWWLTQTSLDVAEDPALLAAMEASGCIGVFLGIESFDAGELRSVDKRQNVIARYEAAIARLHDRGIAVMAGFIAGFDGQTPDAVVRMADRLEEVGVDVPFLSVLTPFRGTPLYDALNAEGRLLADADWGAYSGYDVAFQPRPMQPDELRHAHRALWRRAFSPSAVARRLARGARTLSQGALLLSSAMNGFYGLKRLTENLPADARPSGERIAHPSPLARPTRLDVRRRADSARSSAGTAVGK
jgi:radical SAM superfamily enzyme YgiQ (UPF0313 family)